MGQRGWVHSGRGGIQTGGTVFLRGDVNTSYERYRAGAVAGDVKGVVDVVNNIEATYTWTWKPDREIKADVEDQLEWSAFVDADHVNVLVEDRVVTLTGTVVSDSEAGSAVKNAYEGGAKDVVNKLNQRGIKSVRVQSPLTDPTPHEGFSSYSYGVDYEGNRHNIGDNIGVTSAHTITEPSLNLAMKAAQRANDATEGKDHNILDTLARVYYLKGQAVKAAELQRKAIEVCEDEEDKAEYEKPLEV